MELQEKGDDAFIHFYFLWAARCASLEQIKYTHCMAAYMQDYRVLHHSIVKMAVFWVVAPCSLVEVYQRFRSICCLHHQGDDGGSKYL
jgi:hypothetical protein